MTESGLDEEIVILFFPVEFTLAIAHSGANGYFYRYMTIAIYGIGDMFLNMY